MNRHNSGDVPSETDEILLDRVIINDYTTMIPSEYKELFARACKGKGEHCVMCQTEFERGDLQIGAREYAVFHYFCLFIDRHFEGKVDEIVGFSDISREHRDLLRSNVSDATNEDGSDDSDGDDYTAFDEEDSDDASPPPPKRSTPATEFKRAQNVPKSREKQDYELVLKSICGEECKGNPERQWPFKSDEVATLKQIVKRGILIDKEFPHATTCYVLPTDRDDLYATSLCLCDIRSNRNTYFKMQLLGEEEFDMFHLFRSWGRIGTKRGATFTETFTNLEEAIAEFENDFEVLTGNKWRERHFFHVKENYMSMIDMDFTEFDTMIYSDNGTLMPAGSCSNLATGIKRILLNIFDSKNIKKAIDEYALDIEKMPMGKITAKQVSRASNLLRIIVEYIEKHGPGTRSYNGDTYDATIAKMSSEFYSVLPQSFGHVTPTAFIKSQQIEKMRGMLDALMDIQFVCNILDQIRREAGANRLDPLDLQYDKLRTNMMVVEDGTTEFNLINQYIQNGLGATHGYRRITLLDLIKMDRYGEAVKFKRNLGNCKLLWHGSPIQNFPGILTQGLRIAPPDALQTGHAFGRGVYFADMISKSANYCRAENNIGYLLLCEVALGHMKELTYGDSVGLGSGANAFHSVKGVGQTYPDPTQDYVHPDGYNIPLGPVKFDNTKGTRAGGFLYYNEFIVYDVDQIMFRYLVRVQFN